MSEPIEITKALETVIKGVRLKALEDACKAVCWNCEAGHEYEPLDGGHYFKTPEVQTKLYWCGAKRIRDLIQKEAL